jgi:phasin family protein
MNTNTATETMDQMEKATQTLMQACEEMNVLARDHVDATMKAANACWQGCTEITQNVNGLVQETMTRAASASKTILSAKSMREMMDLQNEFVKDFFDYWAAGTGKISEISARATKATVDPLAEHANHTMGKIAQRVKAAA